MMINIIVAISKNNVIGKDGGLPWHIEGELSYFKKMTLGNVVIMGRRTYESIGHPLDNRLNVVITNTVDYHGENLISKRSLEEALACYSDREIYIAGGYRLYQEGLLYADRIHLTYVKREVDGDVSFPIFDINDYECQKIEENKEYDRYLLIRKGSNEKNTSCIGHHVNDDGRLFIKKELFNI